MGLDCFRDSQMSQKDSCDLDNSEITLLQFCIPAAAIRCKNSNTEYLCLNNFMCNAFSFSTGLERFLSIKSFGKSNPYVPFLHRGITLLHFCIPAATLK